tara:strand:+ start:1060 stop:2115 length:1056 start_codon:yes stop_codon:yes gene_type:complete
MKDHEIIDKAVETLTSISNDIENAFYSKCNFSFNLHWNSNSTPSAKSISHYPIESHEIIIHYTLIIDIYREIENLISHINSSTDDYIIKDILKEKIPEDPLASNSYTLDQQIYNAFTAAITWIYFHELSHLDQEHAYIRSQHSNHSCNIIDELNINVSNKDNITNSEIYHLTELAADRSASIICASELYRHFGDRNDEFKAMMKLFYLGISCALYLFSKNNSFSISLPISSTHPIPIIRLEMFLTSVWETFSPVQEKAPYTDIGYERIELINIASWVSTATALYFNQKWKVGFDIKHLVNGTINRENGKEYLKILINTWHLVEPQLKSLQHSKLEHLLLHFSDEYKKMIYE